MLSRIRKAADKGLNTHTHGEDPVALEPTVFVYQLL